MSLRGVWLLLGRLERALPPAPEPGDWEDDRGWLARIEGHAAEGLFAAEPDFPLALGRYREALALAEASAEPPFDPPADFEPGLPPHLRLLNWRHPGRFPGLRAASAWVDEILRRVLEGVPPLAVEEFDALAAWFNANRGRLSTLADPSGLLNVGGRGVSPGNIAYGVRQGPTAPYAGDLACDLRSLRVRHGDGSQGHAGTGQEGPG